jgi:signal transduction histidine kinase
VQRDWSLRHIDRETTRLGNLVENVLRFSRLGRSDSSPSEAIDIADEVERIVDEFRPLAASRKAAIDLSADDHSLVKIRPEAARHVVVNLLDNAVKYGPVSQTVRVHVALRNERAIISVSDEGKGVPRHERENIWKAFARASTPTAAAGSGIGLTIVRDVVRQNGGEAWVEDAQSGGAKFVVSLPAAGRAPAVDHTRERVATVSAG